MQLYFSVRAIFVLNKKQSTYWLNCKATNLIEKNCLFTKDFIKSYINKI